MNRAVLDSGPLIHLDQIDRLEVIECVETALAPEEVKKEVGEDIVDKTATEVINTGRDTGRRADLIRSKHDIDPGESAAIVLCLKKDIELFFTDDLEAREVAEELGLEPHGTLALVTRAYRKETLPEKECLKTVKNLQKDSTLFITPDLVEWTVDKIEKS